jgi:hypothetical protein
MFDMITGMKKQVLIRGVDDDIYRRAKAAAANLGIPMGSAVEEALSSWSDRMEKTSIVRELAQEQQFVRGRWDEIRRHRGKVAVVAEKKLQGVFDTYAEARRFSSRFRIASTFAVQEAPRKREIELGPEMAIQ